LVGTGGIVGSGGGAAGGPSSGGTHSGGGGFTGSAGGGGKGGACEIKECLIAVTCLDHCGGTVVYTGCCACVPPAVNQTTCVNSQ
ncbi:MAG TPA: hypothetical protein VNW92_10375, partial [Polyangiaceae bacterium]|nr:hypothetical protein [Polyangiaceae bacterium]